MSKYWVYIDDKVAGPYSVDQLIRLRGFSRQARVCSEEEGSDTPQVWTSPADIPELSHIFKAVDETRPVMLPPRPKPKPAAPKARPRPMNPAPAPEPERVRTRQSFPWIGMSVALVLALVCVAGYFFWQRNTHQRLENERRAAQKLVEGVSIPTGNGAVPFKQFLEQKNIQPRWEFDRQPSDLYNVSVIWFENGANNVPSSIVNAFEVNLEAQTVRPLNSKAAKLLAGTPSVAAKPTPETPPKPKVPEFKDALADWQNAIQSGDFETVWNGYSERKIRDMAKGGISHAGFVRLQTLTHKLESGTQIDIVKTKTEGTESRLVLLKQTQKGQPDVFIRQYWILENGNWKLDDEQKKSAGSPAAEPAAAAPPTPETATSPARPPVSSLPGVSH